MSVNLDLPGLVDIRQPIVGDSFGWAGLEPTAAKKSVVFHHSGSDASTEDGFSIASYHFSTKEWGGIGYHFVITRSDYPGRAPFTSPGAQIQYVGDLGTWRAHVANQNPGRVGVCFVGMAPDQEQLKLGRQLMEYLIAPNNILPSINFMNQATVHRLVPEQSTACPGDEYTTWLPYLQGGAWPYAVPVPVAAPAPETPEQGKGGASLPEGITNLVIRSEKKTVQQVGAVAVDLLTGATIEASRATLKVGDVVEVGSYVDAQGKTWARTEWSTTNSRFNGIDTVYFDLPAPAPTPVPDPAPVDPGDKVLDGVLAPAAATGPVEIPDLPGVWSKFLDLVASIVALIVKKKGA
jgi:hypothetical protein